MGIIAKRKKIGYQMLDSNSKDFKRWTFNSDGRFLVKSLIPNLLDCWAPIDDGCIRLFSGRKFQRKLKFFF